MSYKLSEEKDFVIKYIRNDIKNEEVLIDIKNNSVKEIIYKTKKKTKDKPQKKEDDKNILDIFSQEKIQESYSKKIKNIKFFPFDTVIDIKKKISYLISNNDYQISWYNITLFWGINRTAYEIYIYKLLYDININHFFDIVNNKKKFEDYDEKILFDKFFNTIFKHNKNLIKIINLENNILLNLILENNNEINFIVLDDVLEIFNIKNKDIEFLNNFYYLFIIKYFPQYTFDIFFDFIKNTNEFYKKYNSLLTINEEELFLKQDFYLNVIKHETKIEFKYKKINSLLYNFNDNIFIANLTSITDISIDDQENIESPETNMDELKILDMVNKKLNIKLLFDFLHINTNPLFIKYIYLLYYRKTYKKYQSKFYPDKIFKERYEDFKKYIYTYFKHSSIDIISTDTNEDRKDLDYLINDQDNNIEIKEVNKVKHFFDLKFKEYKSLEIIKKNNLLIYFLNIFDPNYPLFLKIYENGLMELEFSINENVNIITNTTTLTFNKILEYLSTQLMTTIINYINKYNEIFELNKLLPTFKEGVNTKLLKMTLANTFTIDKIVTFNLKHFYEFLNKEYRFLFININYNENIEEIELNLCNPVTNINKFNIFHFFPNIKNTYSNFFNKADFINFNKVNKGVEIIINKKIESVLNIFYKNINLYDINFTLNIINNILNRFISIKKNLIDNTQKQPKEDIDTSKRLRKLKFIDPMMFSFESSKHSKKKYSKICQRPFHPNIYTNTEQKQLSDNIKKSLVPYKNITTNEMVFYHCPEKDKPYLGFITKEHPLGNYCIPCCRVKEQGVKKFHKQCLETSKYDDSKQKEEEFKSTQNLLYILNYIEQNRFSKLPNTLDLFFNRFLYEKISNVYKYYIFGLTNIENLFIVCGISIDKLFKSLKDLHDLEINIIIFNDNGTIDLKYFFGYIKNLFLYKNVVTEDSIESTATIEIGQEDDNILFKQHYPIIAFESIDKDNSIFKKLDHRRKKIDKSRREAITRQNIKQLDYINPVYIEFKKIFILNKDKIIDFLYDITKKQNKIIDTSRTTMFTFNFVIENKNLFEIKKNVLNNRGLTFGLIVLYKKRNTLIFFPIDQYLVVDSEAKFERVKYFTDKLFEKIIEENLIQFLKDLNLFKDIKYYIQDIKQEIFCLKISNKFFYFKKINYEKISSKELNIKKINFVFNELFNAITDNEITLNIKEKLQYEYFLVYYKNLYKLILQQINFYFAQKRNVVIRDKLNKNIHFIDNLDISNNDKIKLIYINNIDKNLSNENLDNYRFEFDDEEKNYFIKNISYKSISSLLDKICTFKSIKTLYCTEEDPLYEYKFGTKNNTNKKCLIDREIQNYLLPCIKDQNSIYCNDKKLIIPLEDKNDIINLLYENFTNNLINESYDIVIDDKNYYNVHDDEQLEISGM